MLSHEEQQKIFANLLNCPQNHLCADCGGKSPCWASMAFGVFVCLNCSGAHRALGPSVTRVKSIRLDTWNRQWLEHVQAGNTNLNKYWQAELTESDKHVKPNQNSSVDFIIGFVRDKYIRKLYADNHGSVEEIKAKKLTLNPTKANNKNLSKPSTIQPLKIQAKPPIQPAKKTQLPPQAPQSQLKKKQSSGSRKMQKMETMGGASPTLQQIKKCSTDFSFFDEIVTSKQPKPNNTANLLSLDENKSNSIKKSNTLIDFQFTPEPVKIKKQQPEKYDKQMFMSMGGIKPNREKPNVNFDAFCEQIDKNAQNKNTLKVPEKTLEGNININIVGVNFSNKAPQNTQNNHNQYNKANFASMGGCLPSQQPPKKPNDTFQNIFMGKNIYSNNPQKSQTNQFHTINTNITLESTLNFDLSRKNDPVKAEPKKSWVDEWK